MLHIRDGMWRVASNIKDLLNYLPKGTKTGKISWESEFTVSEKIAEKFNDGNVYLLGDAAHIHSPAGAKGMNLCIEDSYIFSMLVKESRENEFDCIRRKRIKKIVGILGQMTDKLGDHNVIGNLTRTNLNKAKLLFPLIMPGFRKFLLGIN